MSKIPKELSDAMGFRLLSNFNTFLEEYDEVGFKIKKLYQEGFEQICFQCYPLVLSTGVIPEEYAAKTCSKKLTIRQKLLDKYPNPPKNSKKQVVQEIEDDEEFEGNCFNCYQSNLELKMRDEQISKLETENQNLKLEVEKWKTSSMQVQLKNKQLQEEIEQLRKHIDLSPDKKRRMTTGNFYQPK